ncbi:MAG: flavodoxin domain-containing protein [Lachnospiraceae bacterium]|nr:flavodoxin domain-containing protein [Lachnospiraceae bacterium]
MKLAVIYDSKTGNTKKAANWIVEGMSEVEGIMAKAFSIDEVDVEYVKEAKGVVIGSPSYAAAMTPDLHRWLLGNSGKIGFGGKLGGAFATQQYTHGGGDLIIQSILTFEMVSGMLCYSSGGACGAPFIHLGPVGVNNNMEKHNGLDHYKGDFLIFGTRFAQKATEIFD